MTIKEILLEVKADIGLPVTRRKIEKKGYIVSDWLKALATKLEKADDAQNSKVRNTLQSFLSACDKLL